MAVNSLTKEQCYSLITSLHNQATGNNSLAAVDESSFISVAQATLAVGYEQTLNAISQVIGRTIIAVRPYDEKFKGLQMTNEEWGGIIRKINFLDRGPESDPSHATTDGVAVDQFVVRKPNIIETRYVGSDVWMGSYTIYREQLKTAFTSSDAFGSFMAGLMTHFLNERTQWFEVLKRGLVTNAIAAVRDINDSNSNVHLLTEYNAATGLTLTATTVMQPANFKGFMEWAYARVSKLSRLMTERSELFQQKLTGLNLYRHTPVQDQRIYMTADFLDAMDAMVLADTYHDNFLRYADVEGVSFWQSIETPDEINIKPVYIDGTGAVKVASAAVNVKAIVGFMFDKDALGYNVFNESLDASPYNAKGQYYNVFSHSDVQLQSDVSEKMILLTLD